MNLSQYLHHTIVITTRWVIIAFYYWIYDLILDYLLTSIGHAKYQSLIVTIEKLFQNKKSDYRKEHYFENSASTFRFSTVSLCWNSCWVSMHLFN